ncbi:hypothetical protein FRB94_000792 [Tulasnella sp. JGI-2019a]|nr:hypothetical protein FRB93_002655 [Tulasnella sp. JGI-2019a]KAG9013812.1 hypothetical protein FRB94_000792 [Tulasnella sp. JGI-2019a]KAG9038842.1 hypothetical protein FRB95_014391 [Tulasnella sp. JGI-2019a]
MSLRERVIPILFAGAIGIGSGIYIWEPFLKQVTSPEGLKELERERQIKETGVQRMTSSPPDTTPTSPIGTSASSGSERPLERIPLETRELHASEQPNREPFKRDVGETQSVSVWRRLWGSSGSK